MPKIAKNTLGYLGVSFQYKLISAFINHPKFFKDLYDIIDQNMFTDAYLKTIVGVMKEYYAKYDVTASYDIISIKLRDKAYTTDDIQYYEEVITKLKQVSTEGIEEVEAMAEKFFKQQNWIRVSNEIKRIAGDGDVSKYDECEALIQQANSIGRKQIDMASPVDNVDEDLSKENIISIPTGVSDIDECLCGGLDKGKIGLIMASMGSGKALPNSEIIITPTGYTTMGEIKVGDSVIGRDGKPHMVIGKYPQGERDIYEVTFNDGVFCRCDLEHLWSVKRTNETEYKVKTLEEIIDEGDLFSPSDGFGGEILFEIPIAEEFDFTHKDVDQDPYEYGRHIIESQERIDDNYLYNSKEIRLELFRGILSNKKLVYDSSKNVHNITLKSKKLAEDIRTLVLSLKYDAYITTFSNECVICIYSLPYIRNRYITGVQYVGKEEASCIKVDADDELFLTRDFIVTHNTSVTTAFASAAATYKCSHNDFNGYKVLHIVFEDMRRDINRKYFGRMSQIETKDLNKSEENTREARKRIMEHEDFELYRNNIRVVHLDTGKYSATDIIRLVKKIINEGFNPDMIITDYFECVVNEPGTANLKKWDQETKTMRVFENGAKELNVAWWIPSQGNRSSVSSDMITMDQGSGSIGKQQVAQVVISITRSVEDVKNNLATVAVLKNRSGGAGTVLQNITFNNGTCTIEGGQHTNFGSTSDFMDTTENRRMSDKFGVFAE